ncbi:MAG: hypothetical protein ACI4VL_02300 [Bacilli bacterium]
MLLKELVLTSLESYASFEVNGKTLNEQRYLELAYKEVENFYLDINRETGQTMMIVKLEED